MACPPAVIESDRLIRQVRGLVDSLAAKLGDVKCEPQASSRGSAGIQRPVPECRGRGASGEPAFRDPCCEKKLAVEEKQQIYTVALDGQVVGCLPVLREREHLFCPPCEKRGPDINPSHSCYNPAGPPARKKGRPGRSYSKLRRDRTAGDFGQTCPDRNVHSVCTAWQCPPLHNHWTPACSNCNYPNACRPSCFNHPVYKDWNYRQPKYRYYLQRRNYKPFMPGY